MRSIGTVVLVTCISCVATPEESSIVRGLSSGPVRNSSGWAQSISITGDLDGNNPFFQAMGTNGRTCETCHDDRAGWTITPVFAQELFNATGGLALLFRPHDASTDPNADHSTDAARAEGYRLVTSRGLIHTPGQVPPGADYELIAVDDPYGSSTITKFLRFRRPNPISNEGLTQTVTWNGINGQPRDLLEAVADGATAFHEHDQPGAGLAVADQQAMASFMESLIHAQVEDDHAGRLDVDGARGGVRSLSKLTFFEGENNPAKPGFDPQVFDLYTAWRGLSGTPRNLARASIARGEQVFNTKKFLITNVAGLNDALGSARVSGTCSTCHNSFDVGHHSVFLPMNIGTGSPSAPGSSELPKFTLRNLATSELVTLTDLGHGGESGLWADLGKFVVPRLRGLASRAPYFHAGSATSLKHVVAFYRFRFGIAFAGTEQEDLVAFLSAL